MTSGIPLVRPEGEARAPEFRAIFDREYSYVWNTLRRLGVREADRMDVAQEVFVTVHGLLEDFDPSRPLRPWLFGISYRIALRYRALARHGREVMGTEVERADDAPLADETLARRDREALVARALDLVDLPKRAVFLLSEVDGLAMPEIASVLSIPLNTGYSRLRLAREEFESAVRRLAKIGGPV